MKILLVFQESWTKANNKQREKLLELIRRLAEDDKEGLMANKVQKSLNLTNQKIRFFCEIFSRF